MGRGMMGGLRGRRAATLSAWATLAMLAAPASASAEAAAPSCAPAAATLAVRGTASVDQPPDTAALTVSVVTRGPSLEAAMRGHQARVAQAKALFDRLAAGGVSVDAGSFSLDQEPVPDEPRGRAGRPPTARAETRYELTLRDLGRVDALVADIAAAGLFTVEAVRFTVADVAAATDRARRAAMADARHQAEIYAEAGGLRLDAIERISDAEAGGAMPVVPMPMLKARSASVGIAPPRTLSFEGAVMVTWRAVPR